MIRADAERLSSALQLWLSMPHLSDADVAAAFILGSLALKMRTLDKLAISGAIRSPSLDNITVPKELLLPSTPPQRDCRGTEQVFAPGEAGVSGSSHRCSTLGDFPDLLDILGAAAVGKLPDLCKGYSPAGVTLPLAAAPPACMPQDIPIAAVFARAGLVTLTTKINVCMYEWLLGRRPCMLTIDRIPNPMEVLRMQAVGTRVVTMFTNIDNLTKEHVSVLAYMSGGKEHARDSLDFLCHDLVHMELFVNSNGTYVEQVGLFAAIAAVNPHHFFVKEYRRKLVAHSVSTVPSSSLASEGEAAATSPMVVMSMKAVTAVDESLLWPELQYCFSDMNTWVPHILAYLKAKWTMNFRAVHAAAASSLATTKGQTTHETDAILTGSAVVDSSGTAAADSEEMLLCWQAAFGEHWTSFLDLLGVPRCRTSDFLSRDSEADMCCHPTVVEGQRRNESSSVSDACCCALFKFWRKMNDSETVAVQAFFRRRGAAALAAAGNTRFAAVCPA